MPSLQHKVYICVCVYMCVYIYIYIYTSIDSFVINTYNIQYLWFQLQLHKTYIVFSMFVPYVNFIVHENEVTAR